MKKRIQYVSDNGKLFDTPKEVEEYNLLINTSKFKIGDELIWIDCEQGDYHDQDRYYQTFGKVLDIVVRNGKKHYEMSNHGGLVEESSLALNTPMERHKINHTLKYKGYLLPSDKIVVIVKRKYTKPETPYSIFNSVLYENERNEYWYYNDENKLEVIYDGDFLYID